MSGFSNYAISLSIICILAGGVTSFHQGLCSVGGASIGLGWPLVSLFALCVAAAMGQVASAFPTAGGLYHWASILGGKGWGWATAWFNLAGLITVLAAINVGTYRFILDALGPFLGIGTAGVAEWEGLLWQTCGMVVITFSQALFNHLGIRITTLLTDFSGWWILIVAAILTLALLLGAESHDWSRLITFTNYSGERGHVWPATDNLLWLFALGLLLPAYTITGFDGSAHTAEETIGAARHVPQGMVRSVFVSGIAGWFMLAVVVAAIPDLDAAAAAGEQAFVTGVNAVIRPGLAVTLYLGIALAQYLCGLATVTSASRMTYAFARDGGLPGSARLRMVSQLYGTPVYAIWAVAIAAVLFTIYTPMYETMAVTCAILLYISYLVPIALGFLAYGRSWTQMGPWDLGAWYRPLAVVCAAGCGLLVALGMQPPNDKAAWMVGGLALILTVAWLGGVRKRFSGPPPIKIG
jgi:amino acid transporter